MAYIGTTTTLSQLLQRFYDEVFLEIAEKMLVFEQFAQKKPLPKYKGTIIQFQRYKKLAAATTALTEGTNPSGSNISAENVSAQVAEYGDFVKQSSLVRLTAMDHGLVGTSKVLGIQMAETLDQLVAAEACVNGTEQVVSTVTNVSDINASDVIAMKDVKLAVRALKWQGALTFDDGYFVLTIDPDSEYDITEDTLFKDVGKYQDATKLYKYEIGKWFRTRVVVNTQPYRTDTDGTKNLSTGAVHNNLVCGKHAYGVTELEGYNPNRKKIILKQSGNQDTSNPLNMYVTAGWKHCFVTKVLNAYWIRNLKTGATA